MKQNGGCALEKLVDEHWVPVAIRYQRFTANERLALRRGEIICRGVESFRHFDWNERQALAFALSNKTP